MTHKTEFALSIRQPWAWCIATGIKPVENRSWPIPSKYVGKKLLIHAGKKFDLDGFQWLHLTGLMPRHLTRDFFTTGGIVGEATVIDCVTEMESPWFFGKYGFVLENAKELPFQQMKGRLGIFRV